MYDHHPERSGRQGRRGRPGFGPGFEGFEGPQAGPHRHHPMEPGMRGGPMRRRGGGRGRVPRGDVRAAVLLLLAEQPMHGYQLMQTIADRSGGRWTPSPGAIYPTLNQLEDEGLVSVTADSGRKLVTLTETGRQHVEEHREGWPDPFAAASGEHPGANLRVLLEELHIAARQVARNGSDAQRAAAAEILGGARRSLYLLLADGPEAGSATPTKEDNDG
jgi:DNA-binding PadR family transcriptional regulator